MISWGVINELGLNIEQLDEEVNLGQVAYSEMRETLLCEQQLHTRAVEKLTADFTSRIERIEEEHRSEVEQLMAEHSH